ELLAGRESAIVWVDSGTTFNAPATVRGDVAGTQYKSSAGGAVGLRSRTAAARVGADELRKVRHVFQPPAAYGRAHDALRDHRVALLYGPAGVGKYTSALHLLMGAEAPEVQVIDPALDIHELRAFPFEPGCRYVLDGAGSRRLARFSQPSVER